LVSFTFGRAGADATFVGIVVPQQWWEGSFHVPIRIVGRGKGKVKTQARSSTPSTNLPRRTACRRSQASARSAHTTPGPRRPLIDRRRSAASVDSASASGYAVPTE
jgi:hypothetical protein